jgi:hypothetical protein
LENPLTVISLFLRAVEGLYWSEKLVKFKPSAHVKRKGPATNRPAVDELDIVVVLSDVVTKVVELVVDFKSVIEFVVLLGVGGVANVTSNLVEVNPLLTWRIRALVSKN